MEKSAETRDTITRHLKWYFSTAVADGCPGEEVLAEYVLGTLSGRPRQALERHLAACGRCARTVCSAAALHEEGEQTAAAPVPEPLLKALRSHIPRPQPPLLARLFRRFLEKAGPVRRRLESLISFRQPALAYVRGRKKAISKNLIVLEKTFSEIKLTIEVEKTGPRCADIKVIATHPRTGTRFHGVRVDLWSGRQERASFVALRGETLFERIPFGTYRIVARDDRSTLGTVRLSIKE